MESSFGVIVTGDRVFLPGILANEILHGQHAAHPSCVVAEEDTPKSCERTAHVGFCSDGGLDTLGIGGPRDDTHSAATHDCGVDALIWD